MSTFDDIKKGKEDDEEDSDDALLWQIVSSKRSARGKKHLRNVQLAKTKFRLGEDEDEDKEEDEDDDFETLVKDTERKLERAKRDVKESIFFERFLRRLLVDDENENENETDSEEQPSRRWFLRRLLKSVTKMVVLGTGSFRHSATSRFQMMFALLLAEESEEEESEEKMVFRALKNVCIYDPAFGKVDLEVLKRMKVGREGVSVEAWSAERSKEFVENSGEEKDERVFAYMPHCEADLYEEILAHRWNVVSSGENEEDDPLGKILLCGNKFSNYYERWSFANNSRLTTKTKRKPNRVVVVGNHENACIEKEISLEDETKESKFSLHNGAFNDTAVHVFKSGFVRPGF